MLRNKPLTPSSFKRAPAKEAKRRQRKCATCRTLFEPRSMTHKCCSQPCAEQHVAAQNARQDRKERQEGLAKLKRRADYLKEAQQAVNAYVRIRDEFLPCISCGISYPSNRTGVWDAGHLRSVGSSPATRFHLFNINKQCVRCNQHLSSNALQYRIGLINKIGSEKVEFIEFHTGVAKFSVEYLARMTKIFRRRVRHLRRIREMKGEYEQV